MSRFYVPPENVKNDLIHITGSEAHHIKDVMRLKESDSVVVFDGTGKEYTGFIKETQPKKVIVEIVKTKAPIADKRAEITLAQAIPKKAKMDFIVEKATELGASAIMPILTERTVVRLDSDKSKARCLRWQKVATAAAKQCGRQDIPEVAGLKKFYFALDKVPDYDMGLLACLSEETETIREAISRFEGGKIILFIGPEGDFTPDEITMAKNAKCRLITLGRLVLKSDTAAISALSVLNHELSR
ncbi:MAG: 16S rRNA (uracil(1498)-N(3))-methyltransferase [Candidatus Omnitrophica bacterium]|nr:16S rRNA (uracil(1498)-N(3))-methyltransferase [Candidatus Omnitrophota bacterium]